MQAIFKFIQKLTGWRLAQPNVPDIDKAVCIFAHHTSNWDFVTMLIAKFSWNLKVRYLGKHSLFGPATGWFFRALGGIPVIRHEKQDTVGQIADLIKSSDKILLALSPEGTRTYKDYWKTGFYHIAERANVPIIMFYLDTKTRTIGFSEPIPVSGDIEDDFKIYADFFKDKTGFLPHKASIVQTKTQYLESKKASQE
ncbi:MAG: acyltransferase [Enterobacterales bacterium]|nr:acyltransferase [Enterobacterales bacterium]